MMEFFNETRDTSPKMILLNGMELASKEFQIIKQLVMTNELPPSR